MVTLLKVLFFLVLATGLSVGALLVPAHLRSVDPAVVEYAGGTGPTVKESIENELDASYLGPARLLAKATEATSLHPQFRQTLATREAKLLDAHPAYAVIGGPNPYFEAYLERIPQQQAGDLRYPGAVSLLLSKYRRTVLADELASSTNANVAALLEARDIAGLVRLHPASHPAGAPYDAAILLLASLINGGHFPTDVAARLGRAADAAAAGNSQAVSVLESIAIDTLSISRQLDYRSLASLAAITADERTWSNMATLYRNYPDATAVIFGALRFSEAPNKLYTYFSDHPDSALKDIRFAVAKGEAALNFFLAEADPIFSAEGTVAPIFDRLRPYRPEAFTAITFAGREAGVALKAGLFFAAGLAFAFAMGAAWRAGFRTREPIAHFSLFVFARNAFIAVAFAIGAWIFVEPDVLQSQNQTAPNNSPRIDFAGTFSLDSIQSPVRIMQEFDQTTILVLLLFFVVQLVIYCFCLIKIREISKQKLNASTKLRLLENEENLFDFGLYVGLGGTVLSLILVAVGIVEASLMAAYASTLFGILFVALLKVLNLRPYRRRLILELNQEGGGSLASSLMSDIKL